MKNKDRILAQLEEIKKEPDTSKAIRKLADVIYEIGIQQCEDINSVAEVVDKMKAMLMGSDDPLSSIVGRLTSVEDKVDCFSEDIKEIKDLLIGSVSQKELSLKGRMDRFEEYAQRSEKMQWFIVTAIIGYVIAQIIMAVL